MRVRNLRRLINDIRWIRTGVLREETRGRTFADHEVETHEDEARGVVCEPL